MSLIFFFCLFGDLHSCECRGVLLTFVFPVYNTVCLVIHIGCTPMVLSDLFGSFTWGNVDTLDTVGLGKLPGDGVLTSTVSKQQNNQGIHGTLCVGMDCV